MSTPIHHAAAKGDPSIVGLLLQNIDGLPIYVNATRMTPLHVAAGCGHVEVVKMLVQAGVSIFKKDKYGRLPLHYAAGAGQSDVVKYLVGLNPRTINRPDKCGQTPLHWSLHYHGRRIATWLIRHGADPAKKDVYGRSPLFFKNLPVRWDPTAQRGTSLHAAIYKGDLRAAASLLKRGAAIDKPDALGRTSLHIEALLKKRRLFYWLKNKGANLSVRDHYGWGPEKLFSFQLIPQMVKRGVDSLETN